MVPTPEQVRLIFKDTYNIYLKYKNCTTDAEWQSFTDETNIIYKRYPFALCKSILTNLHGIININNKK